MKVVDFYYFGGVGTPFQLRPRNKPRGVSKKMMKQSRAPNADSVFVAAINHCPATFILGNSRFVRVRHVRSQFGQLAGLVLVCPQCMKKIS
jgi:hypothetical protein